MLKHAIFLSATPSTTGSMSTTPEAQSSLYLPRRSIFYNQIEAQNLNICTKARAGMTPQKRDGVDDAFTLPAVPNGRANAGKERTTASTGTFLHLARTKVAGAQHKAAVAPVPLYTPPVPRDGHRCHLPGRRRAKRILK